MSLWCLHEALTIVATYTVWQLFVTFILFNYCATYIRQYMYCALSTSPDPSCIACMTLYIHTVILVKLVLMNGSDQLLRACCVCVCVYVCIPLPLSLPMLAVWVCLDTADPSVTQVPELGGREKDSIRATLEEEAQSGVAQRTLNCMNSVILP